jgi:hypothetical protein
MSYQVKRKGRTITKIKPSKLTIGVLIYLVDVLGYSIHGTYAGFKEQQRTSRKELKQ